jgi:predicted membrane protein (TIGR00267 family)
MRSVRDLIETFREYNEISQAGLIARRAFVNNSFDGVLTMTGVIMGSLVVGVEDPRVVIVTGVSTATAIGISGGWGAYLAESAEREHAIEELQGVTLTDLRDSKIGKASRLGVKIVAAVDGLAPFASALLVVFPFFLVPLLPDIAYAYYSSIALALVALFGLGIFLGKLSQRNMFLSGMKTVVAGIICIGIIYLLELLA